MARTARTLTLAFVAVSLFLLDAGPVTAQPVVVSSPGVSYYYPAPAVTYYSPPVVYTPAPAVSYYYGPVRTTPRRCPTTRPPSPTTPRRCPTMPPRPR